MLDGSDGARKFLRALGKKRDVDLAEEHGLHAYDVSRFRRALGIPRFKKRDTIEQLLGRGRRAAMPDVEVARRLGVSKFWVRQVRLKKGQAKCDLARFRQQQALRAYVDATREV